MEHAIQVFALVIRNDEILATTHDRGLGGFWGLPGEWVSPGDSIRSVVENVVLELTFLTVESGRLLAAENIISERNDAPNDLLLAFECAIKGDDIPSFQENADVSDGSITYCGWCKISEFMDFPLPEIERKFWIRAIRAQQGKNTVDLHETQLHTKNH